MPNLHHSTIATGELLGASVPMDYGQIVVSGGRRTSFDGGEGVLYQDEDMPEKEALRRWRGHEFQELEWRLDL